MDVAENRPPEDSILLKYNNCIIFEALHGFCLFNLSFCVYRMCCPLFVSFINLNNLLKTSSTLKNNIGDC